LAQLDRRLRRQCIIERLLYIAMDTIGLLLHADLVGSLLLLINVAPQPVLATENNGLLHKSTMLTTAIGTTADLLALIAH
jgi:hypothetical protein